MLNINNLVWGEFETKKKVVYDHRFKPSFTKISCFMFTFALK